MNSKPSPGVGLGFIPSKKIPKNPEVGWAWDFLDGALVGAGSLHANKTLGEID
jgi:hypothetical protein